MKRLKATAIPLVMAVLLAACSGSGDETGGTTAGETPAEPASITIADFDFSGADSLSVGDTVTVTNEDTVTHTWTEVDGEFDSGNLAEGDSFDFTFDEAGTYDYICSIHPEMTGTITVEG